MYFFNSYALSLTSFPSREMPVNLIHRKTCPTLLAFAFAEFGHELAFLGQYS